VVTWPCLPRLPCCFSGLVCQSAAGTHIRTGSCYAEDMSPLSYRYNGVTTMESRTREVLGGQSLKQQGSALRILVVEDDQDSAASVAMLLRLYGYTVEVAADGQAAWRAVQINQPDVVLLDLGLPKMDGWRVAKQIRKQNCAKRPFLIAMTGYG